MQKTKFCQFTEKLSHAATSAILMELQITIKQTRIQIIRANYPTREASMLNNLFSGFQGFKVCIKINVKRLLVLRIVTNLSI